MTPSQGELTLWLATVAVSDFTNEPQTEIVGIFDSEEEAVRAAKSVGPATGEAEGPYTLNELADWARPKP
jgi:hypothetical protein